MFKLMKIETRLLGKVFSSTMFILMFTDSTHLLYTEEEEDLTMEKELRYVDSSQIQMHQVLRVRHINIY